VTALHEILDTIRCVERALPVTNGLAEAIYRYSEGYEMTATERHDLETMRAILGAGR
jgi:hypothetical protein